MTALELGMGWFPEQPGGLNRMFYNLVRTLPDVGVRVQGLVAADAPEHPTSAFAAQTAPLPQRALGVRRAVAAAVTAARPDVVASHFALYAAPALDQIRRLPHVVHFHGPWADEGVTEGAGRIAWRVKRAVERAVYARADRFVVLSEAFRRALVEGYGVGSDRVRLVPGGVEAGRFDTGLSRPEARARLGWPADRPVVLAVRRLAHRMGLEDLVDAAALVRRQVPDVLVLIAGRGALAAELEARVAARDLAGHVRLLGFVSDEDLPVAFRAADLSVVPTVALEGFGLIAAESLAAGTPALVTPVGGLPEVVQDLDEALVLPTTGPEAIADRVDHALRGGLQLPSDAECQRFARERYDWPVVAGRVAKVYREIA